MRSVPRRRKPSLAARARPFWILWVVAAGALVAAGAWLAQSPWFRIVQVSIDVPASSPVSRADVASAAAITPGANLWLLDAGAIARRIEAIPYVDRASVRRAQFPQPVVEIATTMRRPAACVTGVDAAVTIDATLRVLQTDCVAADVPSIDAAGASLPAAGRTIVNASVASLVADAKQLADGGVTVRRLSRDRWGGLVAVDARGVTLEFGNDADLARKVALVGPVRNGVGSKRPIRAIDLRSPGTPTVEFR